MSMSSNQVPDLDFDEIHNPERCVRCGTISESGEVALVCNVCDDVLCQDCVTETEDSTGLCKAHLEAA